MTTRPSIIAPDLTGIPLEMKRAPQWLVWRMELRENKADGQAIKDIYVYPLVRNARQRLCRDSPR